MMNNAINTLRQDKMTQCKHEMNYTSYEHEITPGGYVLTWLICGSCEKCGHYTEFESPEDLDVFLYGHDRE